MRALSPYWESSCCSFVTLNFQEKKVWCLSLGILPLRNLAFYSLLSHTFLPLSQPSLSSRVRAILGFIYYWLQSKKVIVTVSCYCEFLPNMFAWESVICMLVFSLWSLQIWEWTQTEHFSATAPEYYRFIYLFIYNWSLNIRKLKNPISFSIAYDISLSKNYFDWIVSLIDSHFNRLKQSYYKEIR